MSSTLNEPHQKVKRVFVTLMMSEGKQNPFQNCDKLFMYFSILFQDKGEIYGHRVKLLSEKYTPVDDTSIPTGEIKPVQDTVFDLREETILSPELLAKVDGKVQHNVTAVYIMVIGNIYSQWTMKRKFLGENSESSAYKFIEYCCIIDLILFLKTQN